jgi:hypothetical protein
MSNQNKSSRQDAIRKVLAGWNQYFGNLAQVTLARTSFTQASLQQFLQADIAASDASDKGRAAWENLVQDEKRTRAATDPVLRAIRALVTSQYGDSKDAEINVLAAFGFKPRAPRKPSSAVLARAAKLADATRTARGTKGKRQKADIKGTLPVTPAQAETNGQSAPATPPTAKA